MARDRELTPEERSDLLDEAQDLFTFAPPADAAQISPEDTSLDIVLAMLALHADVDDVQQSGARGATTRWMGGSVLREQTMFNRAAIAAFEDLTSRLDALEARLDALEGTSTASHE